jgi:hypothetical protein
VEEDRRRLPPDPPADELIGDAGFDIVELDSGYQPGRSSPPSCATASPGGGAERPCRSWSNWSGRHQAKPTRLVFARSEAHLTALIREAAARA